MGKFFKIVSSFLMLLTYIYSDDDGSPLVGFYDDYWPTTMTAGRLDDDNGEENESREVQWGLETQMRLEPWYVFSFS